MRPVSNTTGTVLLTVGVPLNRRYTTTVPDWKAVPSGYVMDALNLACCPTAKFVFAVTITDRVAGGCFGGFFVFFFGVFFFLGSLYVCGARGGGPLPFLFFSCVLFLPLQVCLEFFFLSVL